MFCITQKNWDTILGYAEEAYDTEKSEIGGMSVMVEDKNGDWHLQDPVILKQEISSGNTVLEKDALAEYYTKQACKMGKKNYRFCWWHSHHTMNAFWSGTDIAAIDEFSDGDFSFALVVNLKGEYKFRVSVWSPVEAHQDVELEVYNIRSRRTKKIKSEVAELCSKPVLGHNRQYKGVHYNQADVLKEAAEDPRQELLPFSSITSGIKSYSFSDITTEIESFLEELSDQTITYDMYTKIIDDFNKELEGMESIYTVMYASKEVLENAAYIVPGQLIAYKASGDPVYDPDTFSGNEWGYGV